MHRICSSFYDFFVALVIKKNSLDTSNQAAFFLHIHLSVSANILVHKVLKSSNQILKHSIHELCVCCAAVFIFNYTYVYDDGNQKVKIYIVL